MNDCLAPDNDLTPSDTNKETVRDKKLKVKEMEESKGGEESDEDEGDEIIEEEEEASDEVPQALSNQHQIKESLNKRGP
jgi:hypothetical protein